MASVASSSGPPQQPPAASPSQPGQAAGQQHASQRHSGGGAPAGQGGGGVAAVNAWVQSEYVAPQVLKGKQLAARDSCGGPAEGGVIRAYGMGMLFE